VYAPPEQTGAAPRERGPWWQQEPRQREQQVRAEAVAWAQWSRCLGWLAGEAARLLHVAARTLRQWIHDLGRRLPAAFVPRGRPALRSSREQREDVLEVLDELGPGVGLPSLRDCFPHMARAELADLLRRYRRWWQRRHPQTQAVLHWTQAGTVWAMDFTEAPTPIDGRYASVLAVRDLASGQQLLARPVSDLTAATVRPALASLCAEHGAPLVLKMDNGSAFRAGVTQDFLETAGVIALYSPPYMPRYNGAIEAGIGSLKSRAERWAAHRGRPGQWTWDDVQAAQDEANATARPHGALGPTPQQAWAARRHVGATERESFRQAVAAQRGAGSTPPSAPLWSQPEQVREDREAVRCALEACGYLLFSRRRITLPIPRPKAARI
jgi:transposase InsO family protein